jgi:hypothetical protein
MNQRPTQMTIAQFCEKHQACGDGYEWALANCKDMNEVWQTAKPEWLIWVATCKGVLTDKELRLFSVWSARQVQHLPTAARSITALDVAERYAHGNASSEELAAAWAAQAAAQAAAWAAAWDTARAAAWDTARAAAQAAAQAAAWDTARAAAQAAAWDTARAAARAAAQDAAQEAARAAAQDAAQDAAWAAAWDAAQDAQAQYLRNHTQPNFDQ